MRHCFEAHSTSPNFFFTCGVHGCPQTFTKLSAMLSHLSRKHSGVDLDTAQALPPSPTEEQHDQGMDVDAFETPAPNNDQEES